MSDDRLPETFEIEGRVLLEANELPAGMCETDVARSQERRIGDVLILLERNRGDLEARLGLQVSELMPAGAKTRTAVLFREQDTAFDVLVQADSGDDAWIDRRAIERVLPDAIGGAVNAYVSEHATRVGMWRPAISAVVKSNEMAVANTAGDGAGLAAKVWSWIVLAAIAIGAGSAGYYWLA